MADYKDVVGHRVRYKMYIGGQFVDAAIGKYIESIDPATGEVWAEIPDGGVEDVERAVQSAKDCFESKEWRELSPTKHGRLLRKLGEVLLEKAEHLAEFDCRDNGKCYKELVVQVKSVSSWFEYYGGLADKIEGAVIPLDNQNVLNYTLREPLGVVAAITAWNAPLLLLGFKVAPALAAGNTVVVKPSEDASASTLEFAKIFNDIGFPPGTLNVVTGYGRTIGSPLVKHPTVHKVAFTGGTETGRSVGMDAMSHFASVILELGGKSPNIVFADADLDAAESGVISGIFGGNGEICIAGSRVFVEKSISDQFIQRLVNRAKDLKVGNPWNPETNIGPIISTRHLEKIESYVKIALDEGAELLVGGKRPEDEELCKGTYFLPTIVRANNNMRIAQEEVFGPVLSVITFSSEDEVTRLANDIPYGLGAGVWTRDLKRAHRMAKAIQSGTVWLNTYRSNAPASPFGGYKASGIGRENGIEAIYSYMQTKSIWVELSDN